MTQKNTQAPLAIAQLTAKKIVVLGAGLTGLSCVRYLIENGLACAVNDSRSNAISVESFEKEFPETTLVLGDWDTALISSADILLVSPGIDTSKSEIANQVSQHCIVAGDVELYCQNHNTPIVAVTGSNGKSTVVSLLAFIGEQLGKRVELGGNIGVPVLEQSEKELDCLVLELSSFQLETLQSMNAIAATVLNVSDDHLDRHKTLENYAKIKQNIYPQCQTAIINRDDTYTTASSHNNIISFGSDSAKDGSFGLETIAGKVQLMFGSTSLIGVNELPIAGLHNAMNCLAALALGYSAGWPLTGMLEHLINFNGLSHRCQLVSQYNDVQWINDSKATNVGATLAAIAGLSATISPENNLYLIAGGDGKGADFLPLKSVMAKHVAKVYTLGKDGDEIAVLVNNPIQVNSIEAAVCHVSEYAQAGDVVLLSPACASIDMFKNFAERGKVFIDAVKSLQNGQSIKVIKGRNV